ncbi:acyl CoA--acetate/3-ketoacid CoA transferase subunit beta [Candidatus Methylomirabilis limnetica]|uniref:Acyl CoA--acetate/3-ketoacid CoA transferase subunit beta n=1 Tax=Candidatus Methylomirabilis limnetica TaxID=2033718 RepID=A0A2T4TZC9_9BACT|nr:CoA-transferase [Candidatus Methylomirabilis limnetica]PTL36461.1 acyl CoA--acetate/3-ketoacid CoA transferase subunit beta [Candidatus Methylomirabilis limnetica]
MNGREFSESEFMICQCARLIQDGTLAFIGYGMPQIAAILAQRLHAPRMVQVYEFGAVGALPETPFVRFTMGGPRNCYRSLAWTSMNTIFAQAQLGMIDMGVLGATQIDRFGNLNSTMLGTDYHRPRKRFPGSGGANEVLTQCWQTVIVIKHEHRRFVEKVDFVTSPGYLDGTPGARERAGLPRDTGPWRVATSKALYGFDDQTKQMILLGVLRGLSVDDALKEMEFTPLIAERVEELSPPTPEELRILREEIDPDRAIIGAAGE